MSHPKIHWRVTPIPTTYSSAHLLGDEFCPRFSVSDVAPVHTTIPWLRKDHFSSQIPLNLDHPWTTAFGQSMRIHKSQIGYSEKHNFKYIYIPIPIDRILRITQGMSRLYICPKNVEKINTIQHLSIKTRWEPSDSTRADIFRALQKADPSQTPVLHHGLPLLVQIALGQRQGNLHHVLSPLRAEAKESTEFKYETKMEPSKKNSYG